MEKDQHCKEILVIRNWKEEIIEYFEDREIDGKALLVITSSEEKLDETVFDCIANIAKNNHQLQAALVRMFHYLRYGKVLVQK